MDCPGTWDILCSTNLSSPEHGAKGTGPSPGGCLHRQPILLCLVYMETSESRSWYASRRQEQGIIHTWPSASEKVKSAS
jgi:hypothetical protein